MKSSRTFTAVLASLLVLLLVPSVAGAETYRGQTGQKGSQIKLRTNAKGTVTRASIEWRARCRYGGTVKGGTIFVKPFDRSNPSGFRSAGTYPGRAGNLRIRHRTEIEGSRVGPDRFRGTFKISLRYTKNGRYFSTCKSGLVRWSATAGG